MIAQFALRLICGMSLMWAVMPRRQVTSGFFRIQMLVVMGLGVLAALSAGMQSPGDVIISSSASAALAGLLAGMGFVGSALWTLERRAGGTRIGFGVLILSAILLVLNGQTRNDLHHGMAWLSPFSQLSGASILGGTVTGMLLGHWYLTTPSMSIEPLKRVNLYLGIAGAIRLVVSAAVLALFWGGFFAPAEATERVPSIPTMWLGLRWLAGVFGPIVVSLMVWRILRYRNTQAATGVLFVGVILAFIGDLTAALLLQETKLPL